MKKTIVLVDDEKDIVRLLRHNLEKEGFDVLSASDGESGLKLIRRSEPDLVVLDINLPKMDGIELLGVLRRESDVPVIFLSGKGAEMDRILGLKLGADDYVVKPFSVGELRARIAARLRRPAPAPDRGKASAGGIEADFEKHEVRVKGKSLRLTPKEFLVLKLLLGANGKVLSRDQLLETIWGHEKDMEIDTRTVDQHVARLRRKLGGQAKRIVTVSNFGYKLER
ncbi:MAG: response regulator transcription factor [Elusimicrobiota bacterium]